MARQILPQKMEVCFFQRDEGRNCLQCNEGKIISDLLEAPVEPSLSEWETFWNRLDEIGLWDWEENYEQCCMVDGYEWQVRMSYDGRELESAGMNDGPIHLIGGEMVSALEEFLDALEDLCGVRLGKI